MKIRLAILFLTVILILTTSLNHLAYASEVGNIMDSIGEIIKVFLLIIAGVIIGIYLLVKIITWLITIIRQRIKR